jgi:hypothetical protein
VTLDHVRVTVPALTEAFVMVGAVSEPTDATADPAPTALKYANAPEARAMTLAMARRPIRAGGLEK